MLMLARVSGLRRTFSSSTSTVELACTPITSPSARGLPVIFLHGLLGSATNFRTVQQATARSRPTFAFDLRNHGRSPHASGATLDALSLDVIASIEKLGISKTSGGVTLVGHSLGGKIAMRLSQMRPDLIASLVVIDIAPVAYNSDNNVGWKSVQNVVRAASELDPSPFRTRAEVEAALALYVPEPGVRSFVAQNLVPRTNPSEGYVWRINFKNIIEALPDYAGWSSELPEGVTLSTVAATTSLDTHFIAGELSPYIAPTHETAILHLFPKAKIHVIKGAGHWVHADKPKEFWLLLASLLGL